MPLEQRQMRVKPASRFSHNLFEVERILQVYLKLKFKLNISLWRKRLIVTEIYFSCSHIKIQDKNSIKHSNSNGTPCVFSLLNQFKFICDS